jgi:hypothetical protein
MRFSVCWAIGAVCLSAACGQSNDHAKNLGTGFGGGGFGAGGGAAGAAGENCTPDPTKGVELSGNVVTYDAQYSLPHPLFVGKAKLKIAGATCGFAEAIWDGSIVPEDGGPNMFDLPGVASAPSQWIELTQFETTEAVYPTLIKVVADHDILGLLGENQLGFGMLQSAEVDKIYSDLGLTWDLTKGTVIARVDFGAQFATTAGTTAALHDTTWAEGDVGDTGGVVAVLNVDTLPFPGSQMAFESGGLSDFCRTEAGAVTACWIFYGFSP